MAFPALFLASFALSAFQKVQQQRDLEQQVQQSNDDRFRQIATNNKLAYNAQLNINEEEALELKKHSLDTNQLRKAMRLEASKRTALEASFGGSFGRSGNTVDSVLKNIERFGLEALQRKDLNREIKNRQFVQRRKNISLDKMSKNNLIESGIASPPSRTGLALDIIGSGIQTFTNIDKGTD